MGIKAQSQYVDKKTVIAFITITVLYIYDRYFFVSQLLSKFYDFTKAQIAPKVIHSNTVMW